MFGLMKMLRREHYHSEDKWSLSNLAVGCTVGFGFIPQRNISGCRMTIKAANTYLFGNDTFKAFVLDSEGGDVNLIVTEDEHTGDSYLSISQRIENRIFPMLFLDHQPETWFDMKTGDTLETSDRVMGMQQSWVAPRYTLAVLSHGSVIDGEVRPFERPENSEKKRDFDYVMFLDETSDRAFEAERYKDGTLIVYATVYRPATDIGEITPPSHRHSLLSLSRDNLPAFGTDDQVAEAEPAALDTALANTAPPVELPAVKQETASAATEAVIETGKEEDAKVTRLNGKSPVQEEPKAVVKEDRKKETKEPKKKYPDRDLLSLDAGLAVGVITEAQESQISIAALIRKVIDLPQQVSDQVMVDFTLSDTEYAELAKRYKLDISDYAGVKKNIIKELQQFVGNRK